MRISPLATVEANMQLKSEKRQAKCRDPNRLDDDDADAGRDHQDDQRAEPIAVNSRRQRRRRRTNSMMIDNQKKEKKSGNNQSKCPSDWPPPLVTCALLMMALVLGCCCRGATTTTTTTTVSSSSSSSNSTSHLLQQQPASSNIQQQQQQQQQPSGQQEAPSWNPIADFSNLAQLLQSLQPPGHGWAAAADPNNRTTMRFFRNNKTFASIVYANSDQPPQLLAPPINLAQQQQQQQQPLQSANSNSYNSRQLSSLSRLINCHLVDLEKHSPDVALFEAKYEIKTVDIEFKDMMQLIEACTEIARLRMPPISRLVAAVAAASSGAGAGAATGNASAATAAASTPAMVNLMAAPPQAMMKPLLVVGRPIPPVVIPPTSPGAAVMTTSMAAAVAAAAANEQQQPATSGSGSSSSQRRARRRIVPQMSAAAAALPNQLTEPIYQHQHSHSHQQQQQAEQQQQQQEQQQHRLTLGEVTPPASLVAKSKIKEALQEITSYDTSDLMAIWRGILPGTNWCGMGDRATSYNDLGFESDIDICCRAHDFCPIRLSAFSAGYGLFNWSFYTRSHCRCDQNFLDCLRRAESPLASVVLKFYFAIMKTTCLHDNQTSALEDDSSERHQPAGAAKRGRAKSGSSRHQHRPNRLFEQLRARLPIPRAIERSRVLLSQVDGPPSAAKQQQHHHQQQQRSHQQQQHQQQQQQRQMQRYSSG